ncbi:SDR family NAD(P)-dependent oxidoreductase [Streptomyces glaucus]|uniref:Uncharacterized protein n=1 Tax=Streptomyces glaucus TaxID=284029 RepID=A0ABP5WUB7_9ACTN
MSALLTGTPLAGHVAVVSGASSGMGAATAEHLAERGASVTVLARRTDRLDAIVKNTGAAGGTALAVAVGIAETVAFMAAVPRHVNLTEITVLPTAQAVQGVRRKRALRIWERSGSGRVGLAGRLVQRRAAAPAAGAPA